MQGRIKTMKLYDSNNLLLAQKVKPFSTDSQKQFFTDDHLDFQVASFFLEKDSEIERHIHNKQNRIIETTSEALILISGKIEVAIYDNDLKFIDKFIVMPGEIIVMFSGGLSLKVIEEAKFIEIKQGPFDENNDKKRF